MSLAKRAWAWPLGLILCVLAVGCRGRAGTPTSPQSIKLNQVYDMYRHYVKSNEKPPHQLSDLANNRYEGISPIAVAALKKGEIVVVWDVGATDSGTVLAYEKEVPTQGGEVLMADGTVRRMTADEFKAAKKS